MVSLLLAFIYLAFVSLGLPDSMLGSAWPSMYGELNVPVSYAGIISMIIAAGTIVSSLLSDRLTRRFGSGVITAVSVALTALALLGFSFSSSFVLLCILAVPYGLGAGSVDATLNNYVALHYSSRHMSWLHCMWGVGTIIGPNIMSLALTHGTWSTGYLYVSIIQIVISASLFFSLPLWRKMNFTGAGEPVSLNDISEEKAATPLNEESGAEHSTRPLSLSGILHIPGAVPVMITFFCYCAAEQTAMLWSGSYMHLNEGASAELSAMLASIFFIGITLGRFINGFLTARFSDTTMIRVGEALLLFGILMLILPIGKVGAVLGLVIFGLGCAPIYPSVIHSTPSLFGAEHSQAMIGVQMASAYLGTCLAPPLFGLIAEYINIALFPIYLFIITLIMIFMHEYLVRVTKGKNS